MSTRRRMDPAWPRWAQDLMHSLAVRSQYVLTGNLRDVYLTPTADGVVLLPMVDCVWEALASRGYEGLVLHDSVDGLRVHPDTPALRHTVSEILDLPIGQSRTHVGLGALADYLRRIVTQRQAKLAVFLDYASRLSRGPDSLDSEAFTFFSACQKLSHVATPMAMQDDRSAALYPVIVWAVERESDVPVWFLQGNDWIRVQSVPHPDSDTRRRAVGYLLELLPEYTDLPDERRETAQREFTDHTDGLTLQAMMSITQLATDEGVPVGEIGEAIRLYKLGVLENPWKGDYLRQNIAEAEARLGERVKGQAQAITKTVDILKRSVTGLTGAHTSTQGGRPRGVLFFAGPTGVGKTELAKSITQLLFGDERAYKRFDMSEFSAEHAEARLLGAPPGYVGYDAGGELVNAVRDRPFSVILFDEIEKAHPRILDKFLQILEDGRITDGRGRTVYFSETILVFTSNLGTSAKSEQGGPVPGMPHAEVERLVRRAIEDYFKYTLGRPEILNRIGDNIVVFGFIEQAIAEQIFDRMLTNVVNRVREAQRCELSISPEARLQLLRWCTHDLSNGGRGIGNRLETTFVNPLARALFPRGALAGKRLVVTSVVVENDIYSVRCE